MCGNLMMFPQAGCKFEPFRRKEVISSGKLSIYFNNNFIFDEKGRILK
jgi:hypothetical protein